MIQALSQNDGSSNPWVNLIEIFTHEKNVGISSLIGIKPITKMLRFFYQGFAGKSYSSSHSIAYAKEKELSL